MVNYGFDTVYLLEKQKKYVDLLSDEYISSENLKLAEEGISFYQQLLEMYKAVCLEDDYSPSEKQLLASIQKPPHKRVDSLQRKAEKKLCSALDELCSTEGKFFSFNKLNIAHKDAISLVGDMIKCKFGKDHFELYKSLFINKPQHIDFSKFYSSGMVCFDSDIFVIANDSSDISKVTDLAHEAGHCFSEMKFHNFDSTCDCLLREVDSNFYELLMMDFLLEENIFSDDVYTLMDEFLVINEKYAVVLNAIDTGDFKKVKSIKDFKRFVNKFNMLNKTNSRNTRELLEFIIDVIEQDSFSYVYSTLIALELRTRYYQGNTSEVIKQFENFVSKMGMVPDFKLTASITSDNISFNNLVNYKEYKSKVLERSLV